MDWKSEIGTNLWVFPRGVKRTGESEYPANTGDRPAMSLALWAQYVLDNFATVAEAVAALTAAPLRVVTAQVPGEPRLTFEFVEFRGVDRKPMQTRIRDPGSMKFQFVVRNLETAANKLTSAGGKIQSVGGKQVNLGGAGPHIIVRDPNNFYLILQQQPAPK